MALPLASFNRKLAQAPCKFFPFLRRGSQTPSSFITESDFWKDMYLGSSLACGSETGSTSLLITVWSDSLVVKGSVNISSHSSSFIGALWVSGFQDSHPMYAFFTTDSDSKNVSWLDVKRVPLAFLNRRSSATVSFFFQELLHYFACSQFLHVYFIIECYVVFRH